VGLGVAVAAGVGVGVGPLPKDAVKESLRRPAPPCHGSKPAWMECSHHDACNWPRARASPKNGTRFRLTDVVTGLRT
jgi:hypothetical protein